MDDKALSTIALELYAVPFDEFMAARTAAAKAATGSGKDLAAAVKALPKPSAAAWAVNMMAVHESEILAQLADLGRRMRAAQSALDARALRELARERRALLDTAVGTARSVAERNGRAISTAIASDVERTLGALIADEGAAAAVQSGLLVRTLSADGVDTVDLEGAVAVPGAVPAPRTSLPPVPEHEHKQRATAAGAAREPSEQPRLKAVRETPRRTSPSALEKARAVLADAEAAEQDASALATERRDQLAKTEQNVAELTREAQDLRARLKATEEQLDSARKGLSSAAAEAKQAARAAEKAQRSAMLAQQRVLRLSAR